MAVGPIWDHAVSVVIRVHFSNNNIIAYKSRSVSLFFVSITKAVPRNGIFNATYDLRNAPYYIYIYIYVRILSKLIQ
jgi:hypothetical protein